MAEKLKETKKQEEKLVLIGIDTEKELMDIESSIDELEELVETAGGITIGKMIQKRESPHKSHYFGKGKIEELKAYISELGATGVVCNDELSPNQLKNISNMLNIKVMTRTLVILDIFASRASSSEGKVQVELAQLKYKLTHLSGQGSSLSRLGGGIGTRGPGEKKLETDRRNITDRIAELNKELKQIEKHRQIIREKRLKTQIPIIALVGYTNAGKSTLLNKLTNSNVLAMNKLFATLETTTRRVKLTSGLDYLFIDTVGFIQKLPHNLIKAFKSTLEETKYADILIHVVDSCNKSINTQMEVVYNTLKDLECLNKPIITVYNKIDKSNIENPLPKDNFSASYLEISAKTGIGIEILKEEIENIVKSLKQIISVTIPYEKSSIIGLIHSECEVISNENREDGMFYKLYANEKMVSKLKDFINLSLNDCVEI